MSHYQRVARTDVRYNSCSMKAAGLVKAQQQEVLKAELAQVQHHVERQRQFRLGERHQDDLALVAAQLRNVQEQSQHHRMPITVRCLRLPAQHPSQERAMAWHG